MKKIISIAFLVLVCSYIGYRLGLFIGSENDQGYAEIQLNGLSNAMNGLMIQAKDGFPNDKARNSLEYIVINNLLKVRIVKPNIQRLSAVSLSGLCEAIYYDEQYEIGKYGFGVGNDKEVINLVRSYLSDIKLDVINEFKSRQTINCPLIGK